MDILGHGGQLALVQDRFGGLFSRKSAELYRRLFFLEVLLWTELSNQGLILDRRLLFNPTWTWNMSTPTPFPPASSATSRVSHRPSAHLGEDGDRRR